MLDALSRIFDLIESQLVAIPVDNFLGTLYVILNAIGMLFASFFNTGS